MPINTHSTYRVCPVCGSPMKLLNHKWVCFVCGYTAPIRRKAKIVLAQLQRTKKS